MNKIFLLYILSLLSFNLYADQAKINITAKVLTTTCSISSGSTDFIVNMKNSNLRGQPVGVPFGKAPFSITLDNCPESINLAHITFRGESDPVMSNLLKISDDEDASATGIAIALYDDKENIIDISKNNTGFIIKHDIDNYIFNFSAAYIKTSEMTSSGKVVAVAYFDINYE